MLTFLGVCVIVVLLILIGFLYKKGIILKKRLDMETKDVDGPYAKEMSDMPSNSATRDDE